MTKEETRKVLAIVNAAYPNSYRDMTVQEAEGTVGVWFVHFSETPADIVLMAVQRHISTNKFPPTVSEVKEQLARMHDEASNTLLYDAEIVELTPEKTREYTRIYDATRKYAGAKPAPPSFREMLRGGYALLGDGGRENGL